MDNLHPKNKNVIFSRRVKAAVDRGVKIDHKGKKKQENTDESNASAANRLSGAPLTIALKSSAKTAEVIYRRRKNANSVLQKRLKTAEKATDKAHIAADTAVQALSTEHYFQKRYEKAIQKAAPADTSAGTADQRKAGRINTVSDRQLTAPKPAMASASKAPSSKNVQQARKDYVKSKNYSQKKTKKAVKKQKKAIKQKKKAAKALKMRSSKLLIVTAVGGVFFLLFGGMIAIMSTSFGIFFSGSADDTEEEITVRQVVQSLNKEYADKISDIKSSVQNDEIQIIDPEIPWKEILTVYAVKTSEGVPEKEPEGEPEEDSADKGTEVVTMDKRKEKILRDVFWQMTNLGYATEEFENPDAPAEPEPDSTDSTEEIKETIPQYLTRLIITVTHKSLEDTAAFYHFTDEQKESMRNMLEKENDDMWRDLIYGVNIHLKNGWVEPLEVMDVISPFGYRVHPITGEWKLHAGVDLTAPEGTPILAMKDGVVQFSGYGEGNGNYVRIDHGEGFVSTSIHMLYTAVKTGQQVSAGDIIGYVGQTGWATGPHLHLSVYYNGEPIDPMSLFVESSVPETPDSQETG